MQGQTPPRLSLGTKVAYGLGQAAEGIKNFAFETFLFFYFSRVLGLSGSAAGAALGIALVVDAVVDPLIGSVSDGTRHPMGRRHPFMYAAAIPFAGSFALLLSPPPGLDQTALFLWLLVGAITVRVFMALYHVPHLSLGAELTSDYEERTSVVGFRVLFGALGAVTAGIGFGFVFFRKTAEYPDGQLNPSAYPTFGMFFAVVMLAATLGSAFGTRGRIRYLPKSPEVPEPASLRRTWRELREALANYSFRFFLIGIFAFFVARGVQLTLSLDLLTYFFRMQKSAGSPIDAVSVFPAMAGAFLCGIPVWAILSRRIDKKPTILTGIGGFSTFILAPPLLALGGLWPAMGSAESGRLVLLFSALAAFFGAAGFVAAGSMMADIADEHELSSRRRQEGIFFGTLNLAGKSSSGIGHVIAGVLMDAIHFPRQIGVDQVPADLARSLAVFFSIFLLLLGGFSLFFVSRYRLDRSRHAEIRRALLARANAPVVPGTERAPAEAAPSAAPSGYR